MTAYIESLKTSPKLDETAQIKKLIDRVEALRAQTQSFDSYQWQECFQKIAPFRLQSSSTLKRGEIENWVKANQWISQRSLKQHHPSFNDILELNRLLNPQTQSHPVRQQDSYLGPWSTCPISVLPEALQEFQIEILNGFRKQDPLIKAALVQYWIVSLHPFMDANGRTAVLAADWILTSENYLPQTFRSQLDAMIGYLPDRNTKSDSARAILKVLANIEHTYTLALSIVPPEEH